MAKAKISVTIERSLLDRLAMLTGDARSRSEIVEAALESWLIEEKTNYLVKEVEAYYRNMSDREREEDSEWAELSREHLRKDSE